MVQLCAKEFCNCLLCVALSCSPFFFFFDECAFCYSSGFRVLGEVESDGLVGWLQSSGCWIRLLVWVIKRFFAVLGSRSDVCGMMFRAEQGRDADGIGNCV